MSLLEAVAQVDECRGHATVFDRRVVIHRNGQPLVVRFNMKLTVAADDGAILGVIFTVEKQVYCNGALFLRGLYLRRNVNASADLY